MLRSWGPLVFGEAHADRAIVVRACYVRLRAARCLIADPRDYWGGIDTAFFCASVVDGAVHTALVCGPVP